MSADYLKTLDALSRMRDKCQGEVALPQICVAGDQTSGKSSLLQCLTGVPFPVKSGICTRAPTVVQCRRSDIFLCEIRGNAQEDFEELAFEEIEKAIGKAQKALLQHTSEGGPKVSKTEIMLRIWGPEQVDIQIVDLPGIIHNGAGKDETVELINSYIKSPQTLILLVSEAKQDSELTSALALAAEHDPSGVRTLRVLTKFDTFDSDEARASASNLVIKGADNPLGPHAVVCRAQGDQSYDEESEKDELNQKAVGTTLPDERKGVPALKERLPDIFTMLIRTNLGGLEQAARERIKQCSEELRKLGEHPLSDVAMLRECQRALMAFTEQLEMVISPAFHKFQEAVHATQTDVTAEWVDTFMVQNAFQCPFFQGETIYQRCMRTIVDWWRVPAKRLWKEVRSALASSMTPLEEDAIGVSKVLREAIKERWASETEAILQRLSAAYKEAFDESVPFGTANHYLYDKFIEQQVMPDDMVESIIKEFRPQSGSSDSTLFNCSIDTIRERLLSVRARAVERDRHKSIQEHVAAKTLNAVKASWSVEKKTVTDAILKKTRDVVIEARKNFVSTTLLVDTRIRANAVEDADVDQQRTYNTEVIANMNIVLSELAALAGGGAPGGSFTPETAEARPLSSSSGSVGVISMSEINVDCKVADN